MPPPYRSQSSVIATGQFAVLACRLGVKAHSFLLPTVIEPFGLFVALRSLLPRVISSISRHLCLSFLASLSRPLSVFWPVSLSASLCFLPPRYLVVKATELEDRTALGVAEAERRKVDVAEQAVLSKLLGQRLLRQPVQHIIGDWDFVGITLAMQKGVLCPRPETEQLVTLCMDVINGGDEDIPNPRILDVGCGTGAIGLALLDLLPYAECDVRILGLGLTQSPNVYPLTVCINFENDLHVASTNSGCHTIGPCAC